MMKVIAIACLLLCLVSVASTTCPDVEADASECTNAVVADASVSFK